MFLSFFALPASVGTAAAFVAGGAAGAALMRFRRSRGVVAGLSLVDGDIVIPPSSRDAVSRQSSAAVVPDSPMLARRMRTGRLPVPQRGTQLTAADEPALALVNAFVDRLAELSVQEWLEIGRARVADRDLAGRRATAFAVLEATVGARDLGVAAWYTRDAVETSSFLATCAVRRWTSAERRMFAAAQAVAEDAALALLAHDELPSAEFETLLTPFEHLVPQS